MKAPAFNYYMHDGPTAFSIELAGALAGEGAKNLEQDWLSASAVIRKKALVVDLSFVTEIDPVGRQLLLRWRRNGATIVANTPESQALAESVIGRRLRPLARIAYTSQPYMPFFRDVLLIVVFLVLLLPGSASAQPLLMVHPTTPPESIAFARYIAWLDGRDPFTESGPVALAIAASLPGLDKAGSLLAIREVGETERNQYGVLQLEGDSIVFERAIAPYLEVQREAEDLPRSAVTISPQNYKFCYTGTVETGDRAAYIFRITPKENRAGLIRGEVWIERLTGTPILVTGHLIKTTSSSIRRIKVTSEIMLVDGDPFARNTRVMIDTQPVGRAELTIIELPLRLSDPDATSPLVTGTGIARVALAAPSYVPGSNFIGVRASTLVRMSDPGGRAWPLSSKQTH
jgi:hypothetical protein